MVGRRNSMADNEIMQTFLTPQPARFKGPIPYPYPQKDVLSVACGSMHLLVLARNRGEPTVTLYSSGQNGSGQLGLPVEVQDVHELTRVRDNVGLIAAGAAHSYLVDAGGHRMYGCGENSRAELGLGHWNSPQFCWQPISFPGPILLTKIASGGGHGMALDIDNSLFTWGFGEEGQTGHVCDASGFPGGDLLRPTKLDLNSNKTILDFAGGEKSSAVVVSENDYEE